MGYTSSAVYDDQYAGPNKSTTITVTLSSAYYANMCFPSNQQSTTYTSATAAITAATQTISVPAAQNLVLGGSLNLSNLTSSNAAGAILAYSVDSNTATGTTLTGSTITAGSNTGTVVR